MITSNISGRLRFRHGHLKESKMLEDTLSLLRGIKGVKDVKGNKKTGSVLITYDPNIVAEDKITIGLSGFVEEEKKCLCDKSFSTFFSSTNEYSLLRFSYIATLLGLFVGRRLHIYAGSAFAALSLVHMVQKSSKKPSLLIKK